MIWTFDSIKEAVKTKLSLMSQWNTIIYFGVYERILDAIAYVMEKLAYTADILYSNASFIKTNDLKSLNIMSKSFSYTVHRKVGANGVVLVSKDEDMSPAYIYTGKNVYIPKYTQFTDSSGNKKVYAIQDYYYFNGTEGNLEVQVRQGTPKTFFYTASGVANEEIKIYSPDIDNDIFDVYIVNNDNEILYEVNIVDKMYFVNDTVNYNCSSVSFDDLQGVTFTFGDGISSKKLEANDKVMIKYVETDGANGNIESANTITVIKDTLKDVDDNIITLYCNNVDAISDGADYENIESIRNNAPNLFFAGYRCGTANDWKTILENFSFIYKAVVWSVNDIGGSTLMSEQNKVFATALTNTGDNLTPAQKTYLENQIYYTYKSPTEILQFTNTQKIYIMFNVNAKISNSTTSIVSSQIKDLIYDAYSTLNTNYQTNIYSSNYINDIDDLTYIDYHETTIKLMDYNVNAIQTDRLVNAFFVSSLPSQEISLVNNSLELWIKRKIGGVWQEPVQIAYSLGTSFIGMNGYTISSSNINYSTGYYNYVIQTIVDNPTQYPIQNPSESQNDGYLIVMAYNTKNGYGLQTQDVRLPYRYQITDIDKDFIFTTLSN
ncbi:MAG TPA: hypothetical protein PLU55_01650 [Candidatus Pacearchaeota archaeon]|nr:hypothetical protein [Candidatus Pacearchaeota archaeon]